MKIKAGETEVRCHCGNGKVVVVSRIKMDAQITVWCSQQCYDDWRTGGM